MSDAGIQRALGRIEGKLDGLVEEQRRQVGYVGTVAERVGRLENANSKIMGWAAGVGVTGGAVGGGAWALLSKLIGG